MNYEIKNADKLKLIVDAIKVENESGDRLMADDDINERISNILDKHGSCSDDSDELEEKFGLHGVDIIRQAEQGSYECE